MSAPRVKALKGGGADAARIPVHRCRHGGRNARESAVIVAWAIVDHADAAWVGEFFWTLHSRGYAARWVEARAIMMHQAIAGWEPGTQLQVSHRDACKLNNRRANLEIVARSDNRVNPADGTLANKRSCPYRGVFPHRKGWYGQVSYKRRRHSTSTYDTPEEAHKALVALRAQVTPYNEDA